MDTIKKPTRADALPTISEWNAWLGGFREQGNLHPNYLLAQDRARREAEKAAHMRPDGCAVVSGLKRGWRSDCPKCVARKFTCDEHFIERGGAAS